MKRLFLVFLLSLFIAGLFYSKRELEKRDDSSSNPLLHGSKGRGINVEGNKEVALIPFRKISSISDKDFEVVLQEQSDGVWTFYRSENGALQRMSGGSLALNGADALSSSQLFLKKFGQMAFGVEVESFRLQSVNREDQSTQIIYDQILGGLPVFGARLNMIFDPKGSLVYLVSDLYSGPPPISAGTLSDSQAVAIARNALLLKIGMMGSTVPPQYSETVFAQLMEKGYWLSGGTVEIVFRFIIPLQSPNFGDMEIILDARSGLVTRIFNLARK